MLILGDNFWTRNTRKLIKVSIDADCCLVSNESFSEILLSSGCAQVRYQQPKMAKKITHLWCYSQNKKQNPKPKFLFHCKLVDLSNLRGFEQLFSTISWGAMWLVSQPKYPCFSPSFELCHRQSSTLNKHNKQSQHIWETVVNTATCSPKTEPKVVKNLKNFINSNPNPFKKKW